MNLHCIQCVNELPEGESPQSYSKLAVVVQDGQLVIVCDRHQLVVTHVPIPADHPLNGMEDQGCACCDEGEHREGLN